MLLEGAYHRSMAVKAKIQPGLRETHPTVPSLAHKFPIAFVQGLGLRPIDLHDGTSHSQSLSPLQIQTKFRADGHPRVSFGRSRHHTQAWPSFSRMCIACKFDAKDQKTSDAMNDINAMSAAELKSELIEMGVSITDCFEKSDLRTRLREARSRMTPKRDLQGQMLRAGGVKTRLVRLRADEGSLGDNIKIDDKCYYAITLRFSESGGWSADL